MGSINTFVSFGDNKIKDYLKEKIDENTKYKLNVSPPVLSVSPALAKTNKWMWNILLNQTTCKYTISPLLYSDSDSIVILPIAFSPLGLFFVIFFSLTS